MDADTSTTVVDVAPLLTDYLIPAAGSLLLVVASGLALWLKRWISAKTGVEIQLADAEIRKYLSEAIENGVRRAKRQVEGAELTITTKNAITASAARYAIERVPEAAKHFGLDVDRLKDIAEAKLEKILADHSPARLG